MHVSVSLKKVYSYRDPGILLRPHDYITKKAAYELKQKAEYEEICQKRLDEAKKRFEEADMRKLRDIDYDDTPIPMNETLTSEGNEEEKKENNQPTNSDISKDDYLSKLRIVFIIGPNGKIIKAKSGNAPDKLHLHTTRFCYSCQIYRPPFSSH